MSVSDAIQEVIERLSIDDVGISSSEIYSSEEFSPMRSEMNIQVQMRAAFTGFRVIEGTEDFPLALLQLHYDLGVRAVTETRSKEESSDSEDETPPIVWVVEAKMFAQYREDSADALSELSQESIEGFGQANALYHVWPYWREFVHSSLDRMRMPVIAVPMFRLNKEHWAKSGGEAKKLASSH